MTRAFLTKESKQKERTKIRVCRKKEKCFAFFLRSEDRGVNEIFFNYFDSLSSFSSEKSLEDHSKNQNKIFNVFN